MTWPGCSYCGCVRNATRSATCCLLSVVAKSGGMTPAGNLGTTYAFGSTIDSAVYLSSGPRFAVFASAARLSRFGPTVPAAPAGLNVWHDAAAVRGEDRLAGRRVAGGRGRRGSRCRAGRRSRRGRRLRRRGARLGRLLRDEDDDGHHPEEEARDHGDVGPHVLSGEVRLPARDQERADEREDDEGSAHARQAGLLCGAEIGEQQHRRQATSFRRTRRRPRGPGSGAANPR